MGIETLREARNAIKDRGVAANEKLRGTPSKSHSYEWEPIETAPQPPESFDIKVYFNGRNRYCRNVIRSENRFRDAVTNRLICGEILGWHPRTIAQDDDSLSIGCTVGEFLSIWNSALAFKEARARLPDYRDNHLQQIACRLRKQGREVKRHRLIMK